MTRRAYRRAGLGLLVVTAGMAVPACRPRAGPGPHHATRPAPRLVITIVIDQLAAWMAADRWPVLPPEGGFARLRREGLTVSELRFDHAVTDTAPGHAALYTGAVPRETGIFANELTGPDGKPRSILLDEQTRLVGADGVVGERPGSSLARLRVETVADVLVTAAPGARVFSFSLKDRGALFGAGRKPTVAAWLDVATEQLVTSTAFPPLPAWVEFLGDRAAVAGARAGGWVLGDAQRRWVAAHAETPDDQLGEGDLAGLGRVFPHAIESAKALRATPAGDRLLFSLARGALEALGPAGTSDGGPPTLLALSFSSHDYVAHVFGPHSWEAWAELVELDHGLAGLLAAADRAVGADRYAVLLTGDHGSGALPELAPEKRGVHCGAKAAPDRWERSCEATRRLAPRDVTETLEPALAAAFGAGPWVAGIAEPLVTLTPQGRALVGGARRKLLDVAAQALGPLGIDDVVDTHAPTQACADEEARSALVCHAIDPKGPADLYLVVARGVFFDPDVVPGFGASHGSPYLYDRAVPLLVRAPGRVAAGTTRDAPVSFAAFARTCASILGLRAPAGARRGEDLSAP